MGRSRFSILPAVLTPRCRPARASVSAIFFWVKNEARYGLHQSILCPGYLEPCSAPLEFSDIEAADITRPSAWNVGDSEFRLLIDRLSELAGKTRPPLLNQQAAVYFRFAQKYERGDGIPRSPALAREWFEHARDEGHPGADDALAALSRSE